MSYPYKGKQNYYRKQRLNKHKNNGKDRGKSEDIPYSEASEELIQNLSSEALTDKQLEQLCTLAGLSGDFYKKIEQPLVNLPPKKVGSELVTRFKNKNTFRIRTPSESEEESESNPASDTESVVESGVKLFEPNLEDNITDGYWDTDLIHSAKFTITGVDNENHHPPSLGPPTSTKSEEGTQLLTVMSTPPDQDPIRGDQLEVEVNDDKLLAEAFKTDITGDFQRKAAEALMQGSQIENQRLTPTPEEDDNGNEEQTGDGDTDPGVSPNTTTDINQQQYRSPQISPPQTIANATVLQQDEDSSDPVYLLYQMGLQYYSKYMSGEIHGSEIINNLMRDGRGLDIDFRDTIMVTNLILNMSNFETLSGVYLYTQDLMSRVDQGFVSVMSQIQTLSKDQPSNLRLDNMISSLIDLITTSQDTIINQTKIMVDKLEKKIESVTIDKRETLRQHLPVGTRVDPPPQTSNTLGQPAEPQGLPKPISLKGKSRFGPPKRTIMGDTLVIKPKVGPSQGAENQTDAKAALPSAETHLNAIKQAFPNIHFAKVVAPTTSQSPRVHNVFADDSSTVESSQQAVARDSRAMPIKPVTFKRTDVQKKKKFRGPKDPVRSLIEDTSNLTERVRQLFSETNQKSIHPIIIDDDRMYLSTVYQSVTTMPSQDKVKLKDNDLKALITLLPIILSRTLEKDKMSSLKNILKEANAGDISSVLYVTIQMADMQSKN